MADRSSLTIRCPECGSSLRVDVATGQILSHDKQAAEKQRNDFDALLAGLDESKERASALFEQELEAHNDRDRLLEEKFKRAMERAERERAAEGDTPKRPERPWDFE